MFDIVQNLWCSNNLLSNKYSIPVSGQSQHLVLCSGVRDVFRFLNKEDRIITKLLVSGQALNVLTAF